MICPTHGERMPGTKTRYGVRRACPIEGCTVVGWDGPTSTPADAETRALRHQCHLAFDPLWKKKIRFHSRAKAYHWLAGKMNVAPDKAHIGMFNKAQCFQLIALLQRMEAPE